MGATKCTIGKGWSGGHTLMFSLTNKRKKCIVSYYYWIVAPMTLRISEFTKRHNLTKLNNNNVLRRLDFSQVFIVKKPIKLQSDFNRFEKDTDGTDAPCQAPGQVLLTG